MKTRRGAEESPLAGGCAYGTKTGNWKRSKPQCVRVHMCPRHSDSRSSGRRQECRLSLKIAPNGNGMQNDDMLDLYRQHPSTLEAPIRAACQFATGSVARFMQPFSLCSPSACTEFCMLSLQVVLRNLFRIVCRLLSQTLDSLSVLGEQIPLFE